MRRRDVLRSGLVLPLVGVGRAAAHPTPTATEPSTPTPTPPGVRATPEGYAPLGRVTLPKAKEAVVGDDGRTVFVAVSDGFAVVDVDDPSDPRVVHENRSVLADLEDGPLAAVFDVKVDGDRLAVVGPAGPRGEDALEAAAVFDVSDPTAPERVSHHVTGYFIHNCDIADGVVYLCRNAFDSAVPNALVLVDAASGDELGRWSVADVDAAWNDVPWNHWQVHDVSVRDGVAYLAQWDAGTWMADVSDPTAPTLLARVRGRPPSAFADLSESERRREALEVPGNDHFVTVDEDASLLGIGVEAWNAGGDGTGAPGDIHLYDVSTPTDPLAAGVVESPPTPDPSLGGVWTTSHNFEFRDDRLYASWYRGGVSVHDVSDPAAPEELLRWRNADRTSFWTAQYATERFFVASSRTDPTAGTNAEAALLTFPTPSAAASAPTGTPAPPTATATATPTGTPTAGPTPTAADGPGLGVLAALGGLGLGAWRYLRRD